LKALKNLSPFNTGLTDLPAPVIPPLVYYCNNAYQKGVSAKLGGGGETVMAGPTYNFNPSLTSAVKLPPFFHRKVIFGDFSRHYIWLMTLDTAGTLMALDKIVTGPNVIDMDIGPDGTLYYLDYAAGTVFSLQYTGAQKDYKSCPFIKEGCMDPKFKEFDRGANLNTPSLCVNAVSIRPFASHKNAALMAGLRMGVLDIPAWARGVELFDLAGKRVFASPVTGPARLDLPQNVAGQGLLYADFLRN